VKRPTNSILANFAFLASIQGVNLLAPLVTLPYLARILGFEKLGILATAAAVCAWLAILIDYGFNLTATRSVSAKREDLAEVSHIYSAVMTAKMALVAGSFLLLHTVILIFPSLQPNYFAYLFSFTFVVGQALLPTWIFQGMERMGSIAVINALGKLIGAALIITLVNKPQDFASVPLINTIVSMGSALGATWVLHSKLKIRFARPSRQKVAQMLVEGRAVFVATGAGNIYNQGPILILNAFTDAASVGKYSIAQKLATASVSLFQSLAQAYFPHFTRLWITSNDQFANVLKRYVTFTQLISGLVLGSLFVFAPLLYHLLTGAQDAQGISAVRYWLVIAQLIVFSVSLNPVLVAIGRDTSMARMYIVCGSVFLLYSCFLTRILLLQGMLISMVIVELTIAVASAAAVIRSVNEKEYSSP